MILIAGVAEPGVVLATAAVGEDTDVGAEDGEMPAYLDSCVLSWGIWFWSLHSAGVCTFGPETI